MYNYAMNCRSEGAAAILSCFSLLENLIILSIFLNRLLNFQREIVSLNTVLNKASCGIENFEFIVSERVQVNPDNLRAMSALTFSLFYLLYFY